MTSVEIVIGAGIVAGVGYLIYKMFTKKETVEEAAKEIIAEVKTIADVNKDGKVDGADAAAVVKEVKKRGRKAGTKVKAAVEKVKKPRAKK
jgi:hypothetical protein